MKRNSVVLLLGFSVAVTPDGFAITTEPPTSQAVREQPHPTPAARTQPNRQTPPADQEIENHFRLIIGDNAMQARRFGAAKLLEINTPDAIARLVNVLARRDAPAARIAVCEAIADTPSPPAELAEPVLALVGEKDPGLDAAVAAALGQFDNGQVIDRLLGFTRDETGASGQDAAAVRALGSLVDEIKAVAALIQIARGDDGAMREAALGGLRAATGLPFASVDEATEWWSRNENLTQSEWLGIRNRHLRRAVRSLEAGRDDLLRRLVKAHRDRHLRTDEAERPAVVLAFLVNPLPAIRSLGLDLVNDRITDQKDIGADIKARLVGLITDSDAEIRRKTARVVGPLRPAGAVAKLLDALPSEPSAVVRSSQIKALGQLDDPTALPAIIERLADPNQGVIAEAALALGNLARRNNGAPDASPRASAALVIRFQQLGPNDAHVREALLTAMSRIGSPEFRPIFRAELTRECGTQVKAAAIGGIAGYADADAAADIRPLLESPDPEIRLAAARGLATCGQDEADLEALLPHLDSGTEPDLRVRDRAKFSYEKIARQLPPDVQLRVASQHDRPGDADAQRRRLSILKMAEPNAGRMPVERQSELFEQMADAHMELQEYQAATSRFHQAGAILSDPSSERSAILSCQSLAALLRQGSDKDAVTQASVLVAAENPSSAANSARVGPILVSELDRRLAASDHAGTLSLLDRLAPNAAFSDALEEALATRRSRAESMRDAERDRQIDRLLSTLASDPTAAKQIEAFGTAALARIHARLTGKSPATSQAADLEAACITLARKLAPNWKAYQPTDPPEKRKASLAALAALISSDAPPTATAPTTTAKTTTAPATRPAAGG